MTREEILDGIAKTDKVINNPIIPEAVKQVAINTKAKLQGQLDAMGGEAPKVDKVDIVEKVEVEKEVEKPAKKERVKFERKPRIPKAPKKEKEKETESPEAKAEKSMEGKKLSVANCRELLAKLKTRRESAKKRVATRKKQGKPAQLTTIEVLKKASDNLEKKVETEVNKDGKLQKTTIKRSTKEVVDIVATIISGIPTKAERTEYINEVISDLKKLIDKVEPITEKMAKGGMTKDLSGNYYSTNDFVSQNHLHDLADKVFGEGWEAEDDVDQIAQLANHMGMKYVIKYAESRSEWNKLRKINTAHKTPDSEYDIFVIPNNEWKKFVNDTDGFAKGGYMAKGGSVMRNKNKNDWQSMFNFFVENNYQPIGKRDLINMAYESSNGIDSAIPQSMYGEVDNTAYYVYDYQTDKMGELVDLREKLKFSNVKVDVTIVQDDKLKYGNDLPSELQDVTFHQALNYVFNNDSIEQFAIRPKK